MEKGLTFSIEEAKSTKRFPSKEEEVIKYLHGVFLLVIIISCTRITDDSVIEENQVELTPKPHDSEIDYLEASSYTSESKNQWRLVWSDEFHNEKSLANWNLQDWASVKLSEWQYYSTENVKVEDDLLVIVSKKEKFKGREFTSGAITTENLFEFTYGKIEIKAKIPTGQGVFPAIWLVNSENNDWLPEIDIMENLGQYPNELWFVVHWKDSTGEKMRDYLHYKSMDIDFSKDFHVYGLIWEEDKITWTIDGRSVFETVQFSPDEPLFIYVNTAIGGNWPGDPDLSDDYPKELLIDYVRIYSK